MNNRINAVYARLSVDRADSISIESQIEFCQYELKGGNFKEYTDKGYSGKNVDRPQFQQLMEDIEQGLIAKVIVYKLDRISRSILDFSKMMELFQKYNVEFVSSTEKFDTSTPMGRVMLNICIVFAQLERETIQKRVQDAYYSRNKRGFSMGGKIQYGYTLEPTVMDGIKTKMLIQNPEQAEIMKLLYEMYAQPQTSVGDLIRYLNENNITIYNDEATFSTLTKMLRSPVYVKSDLAIYEFFKSQGAEVFNDPFDFTGTNSCYLYKGKGTTVNKLVDLKGHELVIAPHEGIVSADIWLKCRYKLMNNKAYHDNKKPKNTWLAGKMKCGHCNHALRCNRDNNKKPKYWITCGRRAMSKDCVGIKGIKATELEAFIYNEMKNKLQEFQKLTAHKGEVSPKLTTMRVELRQVEREIETLVDNLVGANNVLLSYANTKITELDERKQALLKSIAETSAHAIDYEQLDSISNYLEKWEEVSFDDKRLVVDGLMTRFTVTNEKIEIEWKI